MIKISGVLTIKAIDGRNGRFNIGRLMTELGEFTVKDTLLEQYEPGKYEGEFGVSRIYPYSYFANGGVKVEIRACVETIALAGIKQLSAEEALEPSSQEHDPLDESPVPASVPAAGAVDVAVASQGVDQESTEADDEDSDVQLFAGLWPLGNEVKLDPTVDRGVFRAQRDRLKALGYRFQAIGQLWLHQ